MSFKGIVTRKDKETGVDLLAKIVTENKKKSAKKTYKVRVASNGLSDTESCSRAVILKKDEVSKAGPGGADDLTVSINLNSLGAFGTTLTYKITNDNPECPLTDYLSSNGTLLGSPIFGSGDATGKLYITATKGDASITAIVPIVVKAYTAESILYDESLVSKAALWRAMTTNAEYMLANNKITFLSTWAPWKMLPVKPSSQDIVVSYTIDDKASAGIGQARIDSNAAGAKTVYCPSYSALMALEGSSPEFTVSEYKDPNQAGKTSKNLKCSGLVVSATLTLGEASITFEYDITTRSEPLTNKEVVDAIEGLAEAPTARGNKASSVLKLYNAEDLGAEIGGYFMNALAPAERSGEECYNINASALTGGNTEFNIKCVTGSDFETLVELKTLGLSAGDISAEISEPQIFAFNGKDTYCDDVAITNSVFGPKEGAVLEENVVPVNLDLIKSMIDSNPAMEEPATAFAIQQQISCTKYDGTPKTLTLMKWFYITNIDSVIV